jgi:hypothetical protein
MRPAGEDKMVSDTVVSFGSHTVHLSSVALLIAALLLLGGAGFLLGLSRGRRVVVQRSTTTEELNVHLARIAEALERIADRPADRVIAEASRAAEPVADGKAAGRGPAMFQSTFGR